MHRGWFAVHRKIFASDVWQHPTAFRVWIYILGSITHEEVTMAERYQAVTLQPGQMLTSQDKIAAKCRLSRQETRSALDYLKSTDRITIKPTKRFSVITVTNWPAYREAMLGSNQESNQQINQKPTNSQPTANHIQEDLNKTEKKKKDLPLPSALEDGAADRSQPKPKVDDPKIPQESIVLMAGLMKQVDTITAPRDGGNGKDKGVEKVKSPKDEFIDSITDPVMRRALFDVQVNGGEMSVLDRMGHLRAAGFTPEQCKAARTLVLDEGVAG